MTLFRDRQEAGEKLAAALAALRPQFRDALVLGIPRGGVPIAYHVAKALDAALDVLVLRKLPIPDNPEAGFGAVTLDKSVILNDALAARINVSKAHLDKIVDTVYLEVLRRNKQYRGSRPFPEIKGRSVILTDDGLASGFTMLAAVRFIRKRHARSVTVAVPVAHQQAYTMVDEEADRTVVLHTSAAYPFAVASFYASFPDLTDDEVTAYLDDPAPAQVRH